jgi:transposase-like protein
MICPECLKEHVNKVGLAVTRKGKKQRYQCRECGRTFYNENGGLESEKKEQE